MPTMTRPVRSRCRLSALARSCQPTLQKPLDRATAAAEFHFRVALQQARQRVPQPPEVFQNRTASQSSGRRPLPGLRSFFFFNDTATTEIYTLSLHDALPI